jgi:sulfide dehydrogenase cytochrome subunit
MKIPLLLAAALAVVAPPSPAQTAEAMYVRGLAATCANCHGTDGRPAPGSTLPELAGMPLPYMLQQLRAFRDGSRPATVMNQLAKGFSDAQLQQLAGYFAAQAK